MFLHFQEPVSISAYMLVYERTTPQTPDIAKSAGGTSGSPEAMIRLDREVCDSLGCAMLA